MCESLHRLVVVEVDYRVHLDLGGVREGEHKLLELNCIDSRVNRGKVENWTVQ